MLRGGIADLLKSPFHRELVGRFEGKFGEERQSRIEAAERILLRAELPVQRNRTFK